MTATVQLTPAHGKSVEINGARPITKNVNSDIIAITSAGVGAVALNGTGEKLRFIGMSQVSVTGPNTAGKTDAVTINAGTASIVAGSGSMTVTGGPGADTYIFGSSAGSLTINDFSAAHDILIIGGNLRASMKVSTDHAHGTMITFANGGSIDLKGVGSLPTSSISYAAFDPAPNLHVFDAILPPGGM